MEADRVYNFNPGPATLPLEVLKEAQAEFLNFNHSGMSILEISHRAKQYAEVHQQAKADIKELMGLGDDYEVLFCQGGASQQFAMIPLNFATKEHPGSYGRGCRLFQGSRLPSYPDPGRAHDQS